MPQVGAMGARRGVLMTASAQRSKRTKDQPEPASGTKAFAFEERVPSSRQARKASNSEWAEIEAEVKSLRRKLNVDEEGRTVVEYDDVASEEEEPEGNQNEDSSDEDDKESEDENDPEEKGDQAAAATQSTASPEDKERDLVAERLDRIERGEDEPSGRAAASTGEASARVKKRGGRKDKDKKREKKRKKKEAEGGNDREEGDRPRPAKRKKDGKEPDPDRWAKMRLVGDEKPKQIDTTRIVIYHDFDNLIARRQEASRRLLAEHASSSGSQAPVNNDASDFRAQLARNMFDDDDDEEE
eukprot:gnl/TRDRNA2_/TRDRNA2_187905_c0_seq1.p2 gnl/TRDRNA2_/TRDRNA2_187905_c0~~gnl/TRDRNA2_/TRDRNA2_187905_c0_seq1.p2  ORF type:complete len:299 (-),score=91.93 gnl/TRDRNA2_/TRDRNA2_187905_c0_seq1:65-961(-)